MIPDPTHIGTFTLKSGSFIVADPCNSKISTEGEVGLPVGVISRVMGCMLGNWEAFLSLKETSDFMYDGRKKRVCCSLSVLHQDVSKNVEWAWEAEVLAYSGQIGIFDEKCFGDDDAVINEPKSIQDSFYGACCYLTFDETNREARFGGCLEFGAVALSGYGDGRYPVNTGREKNLVVGLNIPFIFPEDNESDE